MESLVTSQNDVNTKIEAAYEKYKKEPYTRRTRTLVEKLLEDLEKQWNRFKETHDEIVKLGQSDHDYFIKQHYEATRIYVEKVKGKYNERLAQLELEEASTRGSATHQVDPRIRRQIQRFSTLEKHLDKLEVEGKSKLYFEFTRLSLADQWMRISSTHEDILEEPLDVDGTYADYMEYYDEISIKYNSTMATLLGNEVTDSNQPTKQRTSDFRLPRVNIPRFDGDYKQWTAFHDIYLNVVHNNEKLSGAEKMQFLKSQLTGEAAKIIRHLNISEAGYEPAWNIICERYNNKRVQFTTHADILLNQPKVEIKSASGIKQLHDTTKECLHNIQNLGIDSSSWGPLIVHIIRKKLDDDSLEQYENFFKKPKELQTLEELYQFLETRFQSLEAAPSFKLNSTDQKVQKSQSSPDRKAQQGKQFNSEPKSNSSFKSTYTAIETSCCLCKSKHPLYFCPEFLGMKPTDRLGFVTKENICLNCVKSHDEGKCRSTTGCRVCQQKHNTILHDAFVQQTEVKSMVSTSKQSPHQTVLPTCQIQVQAKDGSFQSFRGLIDQGSQGTFITDKAVQLLGLKRQSTHENVSGMGKKSAGPIKSKVQLLLKPRFPSLFSTTATANVIKTLTRDLPNEDFINDNWEHLKGIILADPQFNVSGPIDILLGADVISEILLSGLLKGPKTTPLAQQTEFGWMVSGKIQVSRSNNTKITTLTTNIDLDEQLTKFREIEEIQSNKPLSAEDKEMVQTTHTRNQDGTFMAEKKFTTNQKMAEDQPQFKIQPIIPNQGTKKQQEDFNSELIDKLIGLQTKWHVIPPASSHFGGLWESGVKSVKNHLNPLSDDPDDLEVLMPGHFLTRVVLLAPPEENLFKEDLKLHTTWQPANKFAQEFRRNADYITKVCPLPISDNDKAKQSEKKQEEQRQCHIQNTVILPHQVTKGKQRPPRKRTFQPINERWLYSVKYDRPNRNAKIKQVTNKAFSALILALLVILASTTTEAKFDIIEPAAGLYIEHLGEASLERGILRTELSYKTNTEGDSKQVTDIIKQMDDLCQRSTALAPDVNCDLLVHDLKERQDAILKDIEILQQRQEGKSRQKRGLLGKLMQAVFGVNDEVYADIEDLNRRQQAIAQASQHQSNIMLSMIAAANDTEMRVNQKLNQFGVKLNKALAVINDMEPWFASIDANRINVHILRAHQIAVALLSDIQQHYTRLIGGILQRRELLDFMSAKELTSLIERAENKLPTNLRLYHHPDHRIQVKVNNTHINVYGFLHIIESNVFQVLIPTPVPQRMEDDTYLVPDIPSSVLLVDYNTQTYFELTEREIKACMNPEKYWFICASTVTNDIGTNPNCVIDNIYNRQNGVKCPTKILKSPKTVWKHLNMPNTWLFLTSNPITAAIICTGVREDVRLNGTGIIRIDQHCSIKTSKNTIKSEIFSTIPVKTTFISPMNFSINSSIPKLHTTIHLEAEPVLKTSDRFSELSVHEENIRDELDKVQWKTTTHHSFTMSTIGITIAVSTLVIFAGWRLAKRTKAYWTRRASIPTQAAALSLEPIRTRHEGVTPVPRIRTHSPSSKAGQNVQEQ